MHKAATLFVLSAALTAGASAQSIEKIDKPFHVELGLYVPTTGGGIDTNAGGALGLGYSFAKFKGVELGGALRGSFFHADDHSIGGDITLSSALLTGTYRPTGSKFFGGIGLGAAQADVRTGEINFTSDTDFVYSVDAGLDIGACTYLLTRYQGSSQRSQRGVTFGVGFRF